MTFDLAAHLRDGQRDANWRDVDLWIAAVAMGGNLEIGDVGNITSGRRQPTPPEYQSLAAALNQELADIGLNHPIHYWNDLPTT